MPFFLRPRFAFLLLVGLPLLGGAQIHPQGAMAFLMGAWLGVLVAGPPLMVALWVLRVKTMGQVLRPLVRLPVLLVLTGLVVYLTRPELGLAVQAAGLGFGLWWIRKGKRILPV